MQKKTKGVSVEDIRKTHNPENRQIITCPPIVQISTTRHQMLVKFGKKTPLNKNLD